MLARRLLLVELGREWTFCPIGFRVSAGQTREGYRFMNGRSFRAELE